MNFRLHFLQIVKACCEPESTLIINVSTIVAKCRSIMIIVPGDFTPWGTNEWDEHVQRLLKRRYKDGSYQQIPADTHGDCGLEGFSSDGTAYQCYSAQNWANAKQLYDKQRGKITDDIGKFLANEKELTELFGSLKIKRWKLVVPCWMNKELIKHAKTKEKFVRLAKPTHTTEDFEILIVTGDDFAVEKQELATAGIYVFDATPAIIPDQSLNEWLQKSSNLVLVSNLNNKVSIICAAKPRRFTERFRARVAKNFISGSVVLNRLEKELPETYKRVLELKQQKEDDLDTETVTHSSVPADFFDETLKSFEAQLISTPGLTSRAAVALANEAVADWLLRCPLDFE
jgi:hypothetical protein